MAEVLVKGDAAALELITTALHSAGLATVAVRLAPHQPDRAPFPVIPGTWAVLADVAPELAHADWRNEVFSLVDSTDNPLRPVPARSEASAGTVLRRAV